MFCQSPNQQRGPCGQHKPDAGTFSPVVCRCVVGVYPKEKPRASSLSVWRLMVLSYHRSCQKSIPSFRLLFDHLKLAPVQLVLCTAYRDGPPIPAPGDGVSNEAANVPSLGVSAAQDSDSHLGSPFRVRNPHAHNRHTTSSPGPGTSTPAPPPWTSQPHRAHFIRTTPGGPPSFAPYGPACIVRSRARSIRRQASRSAHHIGSSARRGSRR